jgi:uncharacterized protein
MTPHASQEQDVMSQRNEPAPRRVRIETLDALRGLAVLGIFMVNVQAFAMTPFGYANPTVEADFGPSGRAIWTVIVTLFQMKFITIFSGLFGAGIVLMSGEGEDPVRDGLHVRRMFWLLLIGVVHAYGFWYGDILVPYAVAGVLLLGARGWSVPRLTGVGIVLAFGSIALILAATASSGAMSPEDYADFIAEAWAPPPEVLAEQLAVFRAPWLERVAALADIATEREIEQLFYFMPRFLGVMMLGMALLKSGFFDGRWPVRRLWLAAALAPLGAFASWLGAWLQIAVDFDLFGSSPGQALVSLAALPQAFGYAALVALACRPRSLALLRAPFAAVGRTALTCYLGCTLVGVLVFYGAPGLGLIGTFTRAEQLQLVLWTWFAMLVLAPAWLSAFAFGPMEWAWRSLTYGRLQPMLRRRKA